jgi:hypothetical protein
MQLPNTSLSIAITDAIGVLFHQQAANQLGGRDLLGGAGEEGLGEVLGERSGYGTGCLGLC